MKKSILIVIFIPVVIIITLLYFMVGSSSEVKSANATASVSDALGSKSLQEVSMELSYGGYSPSTLYIKKDIPVRWNINVKQMTGCTSSIMIESLGIKKDLQLGNNTIEFTPPKDVNEIKFSCGMRMVWGKFIINDEGREPSGITTVKNQESLQASVSCNGSCGSPTCGASKGGGCGCGNRQ